eukprot:GEMP01041240.1.p1 GENE.GEMP01041240.1~~GEMP01041240.1.p1  ORF type:complete len:357 (+),score=74.13 GEMP01041240.1:254-1324(+)
MLSKIWDNLPDADVTFSYDTVKEVRVLDRRLGAVYYIILVMVVVYIVIYVFMIKQQYLDSEKTTGWVTAQILNPAHIKDANLPFDLFESVTNPGEQGAVFLPTRILVTKDQVQGGYCGTHLQKCTLHDDCDIQNDVLQKPQCVDGQCQRMQWCPSENPECVGQKGCATEEHYIDSSFDIWFSTTVHFHKFHLDVSTTEDLKSVVYPLENANTYPIKDLLKMTNLKFEDIKKNGAILLVNYIFKCALDDQIGGCSTLLESTNVDSTTGFNYVHNHYYDENGVQKRDTVRLFGIRMLTFATGVGTRTSFAMIVLQISSAIALLTVSQTAADFFLQYVVPERRHYIEQKVIPTEDFNQD